MGTRSRIEILEGNHCIASIYTQHDGYPSGRGADIARCLEGGRLVNGIGSYDEKVFNGMGDLAAQVVWYLKGQGLTHDSHRPKWPMPGAVYLNPPLDVAGECGEEYIYRLSARGEKIWIEVVAGDMTFFGAPNDPSSFKGLFSGDAEQFQQWIKRCVAGEDEEAAARAVMVYVAAAPDRRGRSKKTVTRH